MKVSQAVVCLNIIASIIHRDLQIFANAKWNEISGRVLIQGWNGNRAGEKVILGRRGAFYLFLNMRVLFFPLFRDQPFVITVAGATTLPFDTFHYIQCVLDAHERAEASKKRSMH